MLQNLCRSTRSAGRDLDAKYEQRLSPDLFLRISYEEQHPELPFMSLIPAWVMIRFVTGFGKQFEISKSISNQDAGSVPNGEITQREKARLKEMHRYKKFWTSRRPILRLICRVRRTRERVA